MVNAPDLYCVHLAIARRVGARLCRERGDASTHGPKEALSTAPLTVTNSTPRARKTAAQALARATRRTPPIVKARIAPTIIEINNPILRSYA
jgi:hypothetical protein